MKIVITGSLGNISRPLTRLLVSQGHSITVVSTDMAKKAAIEMLGATAAIGSIADINFLSNTFLGADAVYAIIPLSYTEPDLEAYLHRMAQNYEQAFQKADTKRIVVMSGWAADLVQGENVERVFDSLTSSAITFMRPASFYTNFYKSINLIRGKGLIGKFLTLRYSGLWALLSGKTGLLMGNYGGEDRTVFVSPLDIADAVSEELLMKPDSTTIRYVGSEEMTCNEDARIICTSIVKPWLKWVLLSDEKMLQGLKMAKLPVKLAETLVEMQAAMHSGKTLDNFHSNKPKMGMVRLADFAREFASVYNKK